MIISELNYLETVTEASEIVGGASFFLFKNLNSNIRTNLSFNSNTDINVDYDKTADINVRTNVRGNSSTVDFDNEAIGRNSNTQTVVNNLAIAGEGSSQNGSFVAVANF